MEFSQKSKNLFFLFLNLAILGFLSFPYPVFAGVLDALAKVFLFVPTLFWGIVFGLIIAASGGIASICGALLDWITGPNFISFSYTNPGGTNPNPIIANGLAITQSLVNMFLVLALIYIAISIALRLTGETGAKKALVRLIFIALIVNFAPVICGLIIDAANIAMNYFLVGIREGVSGILAQAWTYGSKIASVAFNIRDSWQDNLALLMQGLIQIILNLGIALAFLLFTGLFFFRYFAIWILVILSPLAFVAWIMPATKKLWNMWWNTFLQWSIIGIAGAFFLYLGMYTFGALRGALMNKIALPGLEPTTAAFLDNIIPFLAVAVFLFLGFIITLSTSAFGAKAAINLTQKGGRALGGVVGKTGKFLATKTLGAKGKEWMEKQAATKMSETFGESKLGKGIAKAGFAVGLTPAVWAIRRGLGETGLRLTEAEIKNVKTSESEYEGTTAARKASVINNSLLPAEKRVAALRKVIDEEQIKDIKDLGVQKKQILDLGKKAIKIDVEIFKKIRDAFPQYAEEMGEGFSEKIKEEAKVSRAKALSQGYSSVMEKLITEATPDKITKMDQSIFYGEKDPKTQPTLIPIIQEAKATMHKFWSREQLMSAGRIFGKEFTQEFMEDYKATIKKQSDWYDVNNSRLSPKHLKTSPAFQGLFGRIP